MVVNFIGEENGRPEEDHRPVVSTWQTISPNVAHLALIEIRVVICRCKFKWHMITAITAPKTQIKHLEHKVDRTTTEIKDKIMINLRK